MSFSICNTRWLPFAILGLLSTLFWNASAVDVTPGNTVTQPLTRGHELSDTGWRRSGIVRIGGCTGIIFRTSVIRSETWVLTAAHCFKGSSSSLLTRETGYRELAQSGAITTHPDYGTVDGWAKHDVAIVKYGVPVDIETPNGTFLQEYYRPLYSVRPNDDVRIYGAGNNGGGNAEKCDPVDNGPNDGSLRYGSAPDYSTKSPGVIMVDGLDPPRTWLRPGDSGGPWMATDQNFLDDGVILAVTTGLRCNAVGNVTWYGSSTFADTNWRFIVSVAGPAVVAVSGSPNWNRTCWINWCYYSSSEKAALLAPVVLFR